MRSASASTPRRVVINSPNNPSGAVYSEQTIRRLAEFLREKENEYGHPIYLISDEPYREIVYDNVTIPFVPNYYDDTIVCYSYSKSLSLPGERIGYVLVPPKAADSADLYAAVCGAGRALGYVCAPSLFQRVAARCADLTSDIAVYRTNRDLLYSGLTEMGYTCVKPEGAFYLFPRTWRRMTARSARRAKEIRPAARSRLGLRRSRTYANLLLRQDRDRREGAAAVQKLAEEYKIR